MIDKNLYQFCSVRQLEILEAVEKHGSTRKAAKALNINKSTVWETISRVKRNAAAAGYSPEHGMTRIAPEGFKVKGTSTYYDQDGNIRGQWVKTDIDLKRQEEIIREAIAGLVDEVPRLAPVKHEQACMDSLCNVYTFTDAHVGMLAWHREGGADWDLSIAEDVLTRCFETLVSNSPAASTCVIAQLGDFLHYDSLEQVTPTSRHIVDADGRFAKMVRVAIRILRRIVDLSLKKHSKVVILLAEGNHDMASSVWLRMMFAALYENEPRIEVIDSELPYYVHEHGKTMLCWHHGHLSKNDRLPILFAAQFPVAWGRTTRRYAHVGHRHHVEIKEHSGMTVTQHSTLAARDAYAARGGWMSDRQIRGITYHSEFGEVATSVVTPEMLA